MPESNSEGIVFQSFAILSTFASGIVVLTRLLFPSLMLSKSRPFSYIVFFISVADFFGSLGSSFGYADDSSWRCTFTAVTYLYFYPASWIFTTALVYRLRILIIHKRMDKFLYRVHIVGWLLPLITLLLPLTQNTYGTDDTYEGNFVCTLINRNGFNKDNKQLWLLTTFFLMCLICFLLMTFWIVEIQRHFVDTNTPTSSLEYTLYLSTLLYPLSMLITWMPMVLLVCITSILGAPDTYSADDTLNQIIFTLAMQNGTLLVIIYFASSEQARKQWMIFLSKFLPWFQTSRSNHRTMSRPSADELNLPGLSFNVPGDLSIISIADIDCEASLEEKYVSECAFNSNPLRGSTVSIGNPIRFSSYSSGTETEPNVIQTGKSHVSGIIECKRLGPVGSDML